MKGNKALKRALETKDVVRIGTNLPLITDETVLITPTLAQEMLTKNKKNRPVNWRRVEEYSKIMERGEWQIHSQGIIFDEAGNILTGQNRLWAIIFSDSNVYMRISKGNRATVANLLDRGTPQSARDLASRKTERRHSPIEGMIARGMLALDGNLRPSADEIASVIIKNSDLASIILKRTARTRKTKGIIMILAGICALAKNTDEALEKTLIVSRLAEELEESLKPVPSEKCWGKGAAFGMAMAHAKKCLNGRL